MEVIVVEGYFVCGLSRGCKDLLTKMSLRACLRFKLIVAHKCAGDRARAEMMMTMRSDSESSARTD